MSFDDIQKCAICDDPFCPNCSMAGDICDGCAMTERREREAREREVEALEDFDELDPEFERLTEID
jgi:hypothetical protein